MEDHLWTSKPKLIKTGEHRASGFTSAGKRYLNLNQDFYIVEDIKIHRDNSEKGDNLQNTLKFKILGVFDGHNVLGEVAAQTAAHEIVRYLKEAATERWKSSTMEIKDFDFTNKEITDAFHSAHQAVLKTYKNPPSTYEYPEDNAMVKYKLETTKSGELYYAYRKKRKVCLCIPKADDFLDRSIDYGTTAVVAILTPNGMLTVANAGDSKCVVGRKLKGVVSAEALNVLHNGRNKDELTRIARDFPDAMFDDGYLVAEDAHDVQYRLAMTRAIGHVLMATVGVVPDPSIKRTLLTDEDDYLILATDGVWDWVTSREAMEFVTDYTDPAEAAQGLVNNALGRAMSRDINPDNTTAIVVFL